MPSRLYVEVPGILTRFEVSSVDRLSFVLWNLAVFLLAIPRFGVLPHCQTLVHFPLRRVRNLAVDFIALFVRSSHLFLNVDA